MKKQSFPVRALPTIFTGLLLAVTTLALTACGNVIYKDPSSIYAGRAVPPSGLLQRVMAAYTVAGSTGHLQILDGLRDIRSNVQNTVPSFGIAGYTAPDPTTIINYPEQETGYVLSYTDGSLGSVNYATEKSNGNVGSFGSTPPSATVSSTGAIFAAAAEQAGEVVLGAGGGTYGIYLPNVDKVVTNASGTVVLAMVRNSNALYRVVQLPSTTTPVLPPGYVDCEPLLLPRYCIVPVGDTSSDGTRAAAYDHPVNATFSLDGNSIYILNCGPECGGKTASVTVLQVAPLIITNVPTVNPLSGTAPSPLQPLPVANPIVIPGGVTAALPNGTTLYLAGQSYQKTAGFTGFGGNLTTLALATYQITGEYPISDGNHSKMLFADDNTLWIGSQSCANGPRAALASAQLAAGGATTPAANYNCLTRVVLGGAAPVVSIVPAVTQGGSAPVQVPYPNTNQDYYYYGDLTGLCWVQNYHKVYTAYGSQVHAFNTPDGSEINNYLITIQGTVLDVAYIDALTNSAN